MKLILLGMDGSAFREGSYFRKRLKDYSRECESIVAFILTGDKSAKAFSEGNLSVTPLACAWKPLSFFNMVAAVRREAGKDPKASVITSQDPFFLGFAAWLASKFSGARLHMQIHVEFFSPFYKRESLKNRFQSMLAAFLLPHADRIRAVSQRIGDYCEIALRIPEEKIDVIPLLIDVDKFKESGAGQEIEGGSRSATGARGSDFSSKKNTRTPETLASRSFNKIILMACRLSKQKNIPLALRALKKLSDDVGLVIVGKGEEENNIRTRVSKLGLSERVTILPWSDDVASLMKTADVFLISSDYEGYVMTAMEASTCGLPVVMTDVGGAGEFVEDGVNGLVVPIGDEAALVSALGKVLNDGALQQKLVAGALRKTVALPSREAYVRGIVQSWEKTTKSSE